MGFILTRRNRAGEHGPFLPLFRGLPRSAFSVPRVTRSRVAAGLYAWESTWKFVGSVWRNRPYGLEILLAPRARL